MKYLRIGCFLIACLFASFGTAVAADEPILVGSVFPHTGVASHIPSHNYEMVRMAVAAINASGGLLGREVRLVEYDNESTAAGSLAAARKALRAGVVAVIGPSWSSHALAMAPELQSAGVPMIGTSTSVMELTLVGDYIFRAGFTDRAQAEALARFTVGDLQCRRIAVLSIASNVYSEGLAVSFAGKLQALGGRVVVSEPYLDDANDFAPMLRRVLAAEPDAIFVPGYARDAGLIMRQARAMGYAGMFLGGDGWSGIEQQASMKGLRGNAYYVSHWHPDVVSVQSSRFLESLGNRFGERALEVADAAGPAAYDAVNLLADAIRRAGTADRVAIRDALLQTRHFEGVTGRMVYAGRRDPVKPVVVLRLRGNEVSYVRQVMP